MSRRDRSVPMLSFLFGPGRGREHAAAFAGDDGRSGSTVVVSLDRGCVALRGTAFSPLYLSPLQVGRLRAALKTAVAQLRPDDPQRS